MLFRVRQARVPLTAQLGARQEDTQFEGDGAWCQRVYGIVALRGGSEHLSTQDCNITSTHRCPALKSSQPNLHAKLVAARLPRPSESLACI